jgi:hypothetical protein
MTELKGISVKGFEDEAIDGIPYKDKKREEQRIEALKERRSFRAEYYSLSLPWKATLIVYSFKKREKEGSKAEEVGTKAKRKETKAARVHGDEWKWRRGRWGNYEGVAVVEEVTQGQNYRRVRLHLWSRRLQILKSFLVRQFEEQTGDRKFEKLLAGEEDSLHESLDVKDDVDDESQVVDDDSAMDVAIEDVQIEDALDSDSDVAAVNIATEDLPNADDNRNRKKARKKPKKSHIKPSLVSKS